MTASRFACLALTGAVAWATPGVATAHEPLWGTTPVTFGAGVLHGEVLVRLFESGDAQAPEGERMRLFEHAYMFDYGLHPALNLQVMLPVLDMKMEHVQHGLRGTSHARGLGDVRLRAKYRFRARLAPRFKEQHALLLGAKLPTGDDDDMVDVHGVRHDPRDQLGSGRFGTLLGYAYDRTDLNRALWASAVWKRDLGGAFRLGQAAEVNVAAGYWFVRPNVASELGFHLAAGAYGEFTGRDRRGDLQAPLPGSTVWGLHVTPIVTKGRTQFRAGVLVPAIANGRESYTEFPLEFRGGIESFF
jgi:hypothetical protein